MAPLGREPLRECEGPPSGGTDNAAGVSLGVWTSRCAWTGALTHVPLRQPRWCDEGRPLHLSSWSLPLWSRPCWGHRACGDGAAAARRLAPTHRAGNPSLAGDCGAGLQPCPASGLRPARVAPPARGGLAAGLAWLLSLALVDGPGGISRPLDQSTSTCRPRERWRTCRRRCVVTSTGSRSTTRTTGRCTSPGTRRPRSCSSWLLRGWGSPAGPPPVSWWLPWPRPRRSPWSWPFALGGGACGAHRPAVPRDRARCDLAGRLRRRGVRGGRRLGDGGAGHLAVGPGTPVPGGLRRGPPWRACCSEPASSSPMGWSSSRCSPLASCGPPAGGCRWWLPSPAALAVGVAFASAGFAWWEAFPVLHERYWDGLASHRPAAYWLWGKPRCARLLRRTGIIGAGGRPSPASTWGRPRKTPSAAAAPELRRRGAGPGGRRCGDGRRGRPVADEQGRGGADLAAVRAVAAGLGCLLPARWRRPGLALPGRAGRWSVQQPALHRLVTSPRSVAQRLGGEPREPLAGVHRRREAELVARPLRGGDDVADVPEPVLAGDDRAERSGPVPAATRSATSRIVTGVPEQTLYASCGSGLAGGHRSSASTLARATSATCTKSRIWPPSSKTLRRLAALERRAEHRRHPGVRGVARHPRPVDVVVAQRDAGSRGLPRPGRRVVLLGDLARGVAAARVEPGVLVDQRPASGRAAARAVVLEVARVEGARASRGERRLVAVLGAARSGPRRRRPSTTPAPAGGRPAACIAASRTAVPRSLCAAYAGRSSTDTPAPTIAAWWQTTSTPRAALSTRRRDARPGPQPAAAAVCLGGELLGAGRRPRRPHGLRRPTPRL